MTGLLRAAHAVPAAAVVVLAVLLAVADDLTAGRVLLVGAAVAAGQLSIGWSNDLIDERRDRAVGRTDKPLVSGAVSTRAVRVACAVAVVATVPLSLACGLAAGLVHLVCVGAGWLYNAGVKSSAWSWAPYAVAFGGLVVFVSLAESPPGLPPWWMPLAGALLGVGAHLLNVLPDLGDDATTGVRGLPHRIGARRLPAVAAAVLVAGSVVAVVGAHPGRTPSLVALVLVGALAVLAVTRAGRTPFLAAIGIALTDVVLLLAAG